MQLLHLTPIGGQRGTVCLKTQLDQSSNGTVRLRSLQSSGYLGSRRLIAAKSVADERQSADNDGNQYSSENHRAAPRRLYRSEGLHAALLLGCRLRHSALASSSSITCGCVAPRFILGSDSFRARCPKRRSSRSDMSRRRLRSSSGLSGFSRSRRGLPCWFWEETGEQDNTDGDNINSKTALSLTWIMSVSES